MRVCFKLFQSATRSWESLFSEASLFATEVGPEQLICISHSQSEMVGTVAVWYWSE
jgi:hypothetical protein